MLDDRPSPPPAGDHRARGAGLRTPLRKRARAALRIGLLNLMPDAALLQTERQFRALLGPAVSLDLFAVRAIVRGPAAEAYLDRHYAPHDALASAGLDGLIVTGSEPKLARLEDEPFFAPLAAVVDWASANAVSAVFSCLAAHAAVLHLDGIRRVRLPAKHAGVFDCRAVSPHALLSGMSDVVGVPHSRWNDLPEAELVGRGYRVLRRSDQVGVDLFVRDGRGPFVFLQGHPEYEPGTLAREFRRDLLRFREGTNGRLPAIPSNYFAEVTAPLLDTLRTRWSAASPAADADADAPDPITLPLRSPAWHGPAVRLFRNWLDGIALQRAGVRHVVA